MPVVHLIRHARPSITGVLIGATDIPLGDAIILPAKLNAEIVLASPLIRARRTAEFLFPGQLIQLVSELKERDLGDWEHKAWSEVESNWPELATQNWFESTPPNGESWPDFEARVHAVWQSIDKTRNTAIVAHAGVNGLLHHFITGFSVISFQQDYLETISLALPD